MSKEEKAQNQAEDVEVANPNWTRQVIENIFEAEKKWLELATQQSNLAIKAIREGVDLYQTAPTPTMADWAKQGVENFVESQRRWMENNPFRGFQFPSMNAGANPEANVAAQAKGFTEQAQQQIDNLVDARKRWLDFVAKQNTQYVNTVKENLNVPEGSPVNTLAEWSQQTVNSYVDIQKRWLNFFTQLPGSRPTEEE